MTHLVAFVGKKGSGKDTAAAALVTHGYEIVKFADGIKVMIRALLAQAGMLPKLIDMAIDGELKETELKELNWSTTRYAMQTLGTEWGRQYMGKEIWIRNCLARCSRINKVAITDCRFLNEATAIKAANGIIIKVVRPFQANSGFDSHSSEVELDGIQADAEVYNDGTIQQLQDRVQEIIL